MQYILLKPQQNLKNHSTKTGLTRYLHRKTNSELSQDNTI